MKRRLSQGRTPLPDGCEILSRRQRLLTPEPFRDLLIEIARSVTEASRG